MLLPTVAGVGQGTRAHKTVGNPAYIGPEHVTKDFVTNLFVIGTRKQHGGVA